MSVWEFSPGERKEEARFRGHQAIRERPSQETRFYKSMKSVIVLRIVLRGTVNRDGKLFPSKVEFLSRYWPVL